MASFSTALLGIIYNKISPLKKKTVPILGMGSGQIFIKRGHSALKSYIFKEALHFERCNLR